MTPEPTPFDISSLPYFPYVPGAAAWFAAIAALVVILLLQWVLRAIDRRRAPPPRADEVFRQSFSALYARIEQDGGLSKASAGELSALVRRYLSSLSSIAFDSFGPAELERISRSSEASRYQSILREIAFVDSLRFRPSLELGDAKKIIERIKEELDKLKSEGAR